MTSFLLRSCRRLILTALDRSASMRSSSSLRLGGQCWLTRWETTTLRSATRRFLTTNNKTGSSAKTSAEIGEAEGGASMAQMWKRFIGPKEMPPRGTFAWYREMVLVCTVFAITGSSTMVLVRNLKDR